MKSTVFWDIIRNQLFPPVFNLVSCLAYSLMLKMEAIYSSETSVNFQWTTRRYIPEDSKYSSRTVTSLWGILLSWCTIGEITSWCTWSTLSAARVSVTSMVWWVVVWDISQSTVYSTLCKVLLGQNYICVTCQNQFTYSSFWSIKAHGDCAQKFT
jgi:hypothetical protein